jgi:hypothetical protein
MADVDLVHILSRVDKLVFAPDIRGDDRELSRTFRGSGYRMEVSLSGPDVNWARIRFGGSLFDCVDYGEFNQWFYLLIPDEFSRVAKGAKREFVRSAEFEREGDVVTLVLLVNFVVAADTGHGVKFRAVVYNMKFNLVKRSRA